MARALQRTSRRNFEPSIGVMGVMRIACCVFVAVLCSLAWPRRPRRAADDVLVLGSRRAACARARTPSPPRRPDDARAAARRGAAPAAATAADEEAPHRDRRAQAPARRAGDRRPTTTRARRAAYDGRQAPRQAASPAPAERRCAAVLAHVEGIAARGELTPSRLAPLWLTLERNREWWTHGPLLALRRSASSSRAPSSSGSTTPARGCSSRCSATSASSTGSGAAARTPGSGTCSTSCCRCRRARRRPRLGVLLHLRRRPAAVGQRPGPGHGRPGARARGQAAAPRGGRPADRPARRSAIFRSAAAARASACRPTHGDHYLIYSFAPNLRVLNGFIQSLDRALRLRAAADDPRGAAAVRQAAEPRGARARSRRYDTGAWSLYSRGSVTHESDLGYHELLQGFLGEPVRAHGRSPSTARPPTTSWPTSTRPPVLALHDATAARRPRRAACASRCRRSRPSALRITRGDSVVESRRSALVGYGRARFGWARPAPRGRPTRCG